MWMRASCGRRTEPTSRGSMAFKARGQSRWPRTSRGDDGEPVVLALRSSDVRVCAVDGNGSWQGTILSTMYLGERVEYVVKLGTAHVRASGPVTDSFSAARRCSCRFRRAQSGRGQRARSVSNGLPTRDRAAGRRTTRGDR